jgi:hypothetical protein
MLTWAHRSGVALKQIEPGKPNQTVYVESFNGRLRDECLNEHRFISLAMYGWRSNAGDGKSTRRGPSDPWEGCHRQPTQGK